MLLLSLALAATAPLPAGFTDLATLPGVRFEIAYATPANFTGAPLDGYGCGGAWLRAEAATALATVEAALEADGLGLLVYDAYRPARASRAMVDWATAADRLDLLTDGYVARRSNHNSGRAVDLTLYDRATGAPLDMGTPFDTFSAASHTTHATGAVLTNRLRLRDAMVSAGFTPYSREWWHFAWSAADPTPVDVPYPPCPEPR